MHVRGDCSSGARPQFSFPVAKRIGTMNESSLSAISAGGGGNGAARLIRSSASASSGADPELLTIRLLTMLPCRSMLKGETDHTLDAARLRRIPLKVSEARYYRLLPTRGRRRHRSLR